MRDYADPSFRELVADTAARAGLALERDLRSRASTDSVIPSRAGHPTATLSSVTDWRSLANYHWPSDVPENLDYGTVGGAVALTYAVAEALVSRPGARGRSAGSRAGRASGSRSSSRASRRAAPRRGRGR